MLLIRNAHELMEAFRPLDLRLFELPDEATYPLLVRDYRAWLETGGARIYLVYEDPDTHKPRGLIFRRPNARGAGGVSHMCNWCHSYGGPDEIGLLLAEESARRRVGVVVCRDLGCRERVEEAGDLAGRDTAEAKRRVVERMARFANEALGLDTAHAG
ncbi:FBP domain-containing protein [Vulgatibacter sp.]|uniref:FBP domain-containing protein n=1 Tax=Vulgatibacter sp. TaxID=1971226 RepID=UPI0035675118